MFLIIVSGGGGGGGGAGNCVFGGGTDRIMDCLGGWMFVIKSRGDQWKRSSIWGI